MQSITSDQNPRLKKAMRLHESRGRRQQQRIIIFGENEIRQALRAGTKIDEIFVLDSVQSDSDNDVLEVAGKDVAILTLPDQLFKKLSFGDRHGSLVAVAQRPDTSLSNINLKPNSLCVVLEAIEKPGNIGAVFRSADAAGVDAILLADVKCDAFHPNAIRASLGTVFSIPCATASNKAIQDFLREQGIQIATAKVDAKTNYFDLDMYQGTALVFGSEHAGLSDAWNDQVTDVTIPMAGSADSLNISASAAVMMFEAQRQRTAKK